MVDRLHTLVSGAELAQMTDAILDPALLPSR
jgi:hypothetical protein